MIEADHHPSLHVDFGKFLPKLASYVNYLFARNTVVTVTVSPLSFKSKLDKRWMALSLSGTYISYNLQIEIIETGSRSKVL